MNGRIYAKKKQNKEKKDLIGVLVCDSMALLPVTTKIVQENHFCLNTPKIQ